LSTPVRRVIAYLAICGEGMATRQAIAEALWPDRDVASARVNLRQALTQERRSGCQLVEADYETLNLHPGVSVDLHRALLAARRLLGGPAHEWADPSHFLHDILPSWDEPWLFVERERFGQLRLDCLEEIGRRWLEESQYGQAIAVAQSAVAADRLRETAQLLLIQAYLGQGNRAQAVRQYRNYAAQLEESLGLQPSAMLMALVGA
jgi:DNA-binding SARP family transcriptional activator